MRVVRLRSPRPEDAPALARIWVENARYYVAIDPVAFQIPNMDGLVDWFEGFLREEPKEEELSLVEELGAEVVGSLEAHLVEPFAGAERQIVRELSNRRLFVDHVGVDRRHWRQGIGRSLMDAAEAWGRAHGASMVCLDTYARSPVSVPFYEEGLGYDRHSVNYRKAL